MSNQRKGPKRSWSVGAERGGHGAEWRGWEQLGPRQEVLQSIALGTALRGYEPMVSKSDMDTFVLERYPPF